MKKVLPVLILLSNVAFAQQQEREGALNVQDLKCEYATEPIGVDTPFPQLSWRLASAERGTLQSAYQIIVADTPDGLVRGDGNMWDSGKRASSASTAVMYAGKELKSRGRYYWKARVWDARGRVSEWSAPTFFEIGLLDQSEWKGEWVGFTAGREGRVLYLKRVFNLEKEVRQARVYIAGLGYSVLRLNGTRVGDHVLDPATSEYSKRVYYSTHDVTDLLKKENVMVVTLGPGWYGIPKLRMQLEITFVDGSTEMITSTDVRRVSTGPIVRSGIFDGELYDAREENPEIYSEDPINELNTKWGYAQIADPPGGTMVSQMVEPIKVVATLRPQKISEPTPGVYVVDAGQNVAGWASIKVRGVRGTTITLRFAESLYDNGTVNQENLRSAEARDTYILKGSGLEESWEPSFTYHGFRYVQVEGFPYRLQPEDVEIRVVRSAVNRVGQFACSDTLLNRIHKMVEWTEGNNLHSIPTDCPQRDERMGWLNDLTVRIEEALYNFDLARFYAKFIQDIRDTQSEDGSIADTAPFKYGARPADPVCTSYLLLAWKSYEFYGNKEIIRRHYDGLKGWVDYLISRTKDGIVEYSYYGDWSPPTEFGHGPYGAVSKYTPGVFMSTGFLYYDCELIAQMARLLGKESDKAYYEKMAARTAAAFNNKYWNEQRGGYASNNQACNSFALYLGLVPKERIPRVVANLVKDVKERGYHLTTGNLCTKYVLEALTTFGHHEVAYKIVRQETYPSWGYMLAKGATTLWERWEGNVSAAMNSLDHPMMGSVDTWFYKYCLGILPDVQHPGFEEFTLRPHIFNELTSASGEYASVKGTIKSAWKKETGSLYFDVTIPENSTATVFVPTQKVKSITESNTPLAQVKEVKFLRIEDKYAVYKVGSGSYHFKSDW
jgi:alpha-L-rhamnosidase